MPLDTISEKPNEQKKCSGVLILCPKVTHSVHWGISPPSKTPHPLFSSLTPCYLLKVTKFLVKISQTDFLVMTEKNIFVFQLFLSLNFSDFTRTWRSCQAPPFWKFDTRFIHPQQKWGWLGGGVYTMDPFPPFSTQ